MNLRVVPIYDDHNRNKQHLFKVTSSGGVYYNQSLYFEKPLYKWTQINRKHGYYHYLLRYIETLNCKTVIEYYRKFAKKGEA